MFKCRTTMFALTAIAWAGLPAAGGAAGGRVQLATPPVGIPPNITQDLSGTDTACTAVNLHNRAINLEMSVIVYDNDTLDIDDLSISPEQSAIQTQTVELQPGEATVLVYDNSNLSSDSILPSCVLSYRGNPNKVKAAIIHSQGGGQTVISLPAEPVGMGK